MSYLIDGNNLLMAHRPGQRDTDQASRRELLDELARFVAHSKVRIAVVFDGAPDRFFPDGARYKGIQIFYAKLSSNADERIKIMVESSPERRTLVVVTSDRALADYVRRCGARTVSAREFRGRLDAQAEAAATNKPTNERAGVPPADVNQWMRYFGVAPEDDQDQG